MACGDDAVHPRGWFLLEDVMGRASRVPPPRVVDASGIDTVEAAAKQSLYAWHNEWASIAESVVKRRDYLIRLELSTRRKAKPAAKSAPAPVGRAAGADVWC